MSVEEWPGLHPGTGFNDHMHVWEHYSLDDGLIRACVFCGWPHPDDIHRVLHVEKVQ